MRGRHTVREYEVREYETIQDFDQEELEELRSLGENVFVFEKKPDDTLAASNYTLAASNYVGIVTTKRGTVVEVLPKIDLGPDDETTKHFFLRMLRCSRYLRCPEKLPQGESNIRAVRRFPILHVFVRQFLITLKALTRSGLAKRYVPVEENLPYLRGRLLFREQIRENLTNQARFYVAHDELSVDRPANRLIHSALTKLAPLARNTENRRLLRLMRQFMEAADVPQSANPHADWQRHQVDRSMSHYKPVMQWVKLFLFKQGLATYYGPHRNLSLLFPMEEVFEDYVTHSFQSHQEAYAARAKQPQKKLACINNQKAFTMEPDITLSAGNRVVFILDAKWKRIDASPDDPRHGISQDDLYQLYAYAKGYGCEAVALVYPQTQTFKIRKTCHADKTEFRYQLPDGVTLLCLPFDVAHPQESVQHSIAALTGS